MLRKGADREMKSLPVFGGENTERRWSPSRTQERKNEKQVSKAKKRMLNQSLDRLSL